MAFSIYSSRVSCLFFIYWLLCTKQNMKLCKLKVDTDRFSDSPGRVSYGDIDHWMWRLYLDDFGEFCDSIGLPVCPYAELRPDDPLPPSTTLLYGISPRVIEKPQYWPSRSVDSSVSGLISVCLLGTIGRN